MVVPTRDILVHEQLSFVERVKAEGREIEVMLMKGCFHGWLELPGAVVGEETRRRVFERCVEIVREVHGEYGFVYGEG